MSCIQIVEYCKGPEQRKFRSIDLSAFCARYWQAGGYVPALRTTRPKLKADGGARGASGFEYKSAAAGQSGETEPKWVGPLSAHVADGSVDWVAQAISNDSLERTILADGDVEWIAEDGIVVADPVLFNTGGEQAIGIYTEGGTAGTSYLVIARVSFSDETIEDFGMRWTIEAAV